MLSFGTVNMVYEFNSEKASMPQVGGIIVPTLTDCSLEQ